MSFTNDPAMNHEPFVDTREEAGTQLERGRNLRISFLLIFVTMIWGSTFLVTKYTIQFTGPFAYLAYCFGIGALTLALIFRRRLARLTFLELRSGIVLGLFLFMGYAMQTLGLQYTITSKAGFITGLYIPLVPVFSIILLRQRPGREALIGILLSATRLTLLSLNKDFNLDFGLGETLLLGGAFAFALHIVCISKFVRRAEATNLAIIQLAVTSLLSLVALSFAHESVLLPATAPVWGAVLFMGVVDIAFCLMMMNWAQQYISSTRAVLIYALEPVWAGLVGTLAGQNLGALAWVGGACICLGMVVSEVRLALLLKMLARSVSVCRDVLFKVR